MTAYYCTAIDGSPSDGHSIFLRIVSMWVRFAIVVLVWANPVFAQALDERRMACDAGDQVACMVLRAFENAANRALSNDQAAEPTQVETRAAAPGDSLNATPPIDNENAPSSRGLAWWQKLLIACGVLYLLSSFARGILRANEKSKKQNVWSGDLLPLPKILPGERLGQGDLVNETDPKRQIVPWDTARVMNWIDQERLRIKSEVTDPDIKEYARLASEGKSIPEQLKQCISEKSHAMLDARGGDESFIWTDINIRFHQLTRAKYGHTGGAYILANSAHYYNQFELSNELKFSLWRLDADRDFNPAAVNMWGLIHENGIYENEFVDIPTCEAYLRHFFNLGAWDGHYHIASQLLNFYLASPWLRPDEGYVAAAMGRIREIDKVSYNDWLRFMERNKLEFDLADQSVSRNGLLFDLEAQKAGTIQ